MEWEREPSKIKPFPEQAMISRQNGAMDYPGVDSGCDPELTFMPCGQGAGMINEIKPVAEVMADLLRETGETLRRSQELLAERSGGQYSPSAPR